MNGNEGNAGWAPRFPAAVCFVHLSSAAPQVGKCGKQLPNVRRAPSSGRGRQRVGGFCCSMFTLARRPLISTQHC